MKFLIEKLATTFHVYHGSKADFNTFSQEYIGTTNGLARGYGFYFTDQEYIAQSYGEYIYEADITINNPFSEDEITITRNQVKRFIREYVDPDATLGYLSDWGDINSQSYESILNEAVDSIFLYNNSDVDIITELLSALPDKTDNVFDAFIKIFGKDGIIAPGYSEIDGDRVMTYIVFSNSQIKNLKKKHRGA